MAPDSVAFRSVFDHGNFVTSAIDARNLVWVGAGVSIGAAARWAVDAVFADVVTLVIVNGVGCAVMGVVGAQRSVRTARFVGTGFCGGFTTMSSAAVAVGAEFADREWLAGMGTLALLVAAAMVGFELGRRVRTAT